jgi:hypothetical protein
MVLLPLPPFRLNKTTVFKLLPKLNSIIPVLLYINIQIWRGLSIE